LPDSESEEEFWQSIEKIFDELLSRALKQYGPEGAGNKLGEVLRSAEMSVVKKVVPRAIAKHADPQIALELTKLIERQPDAIGALREVGVSIANSLRPIAGQRFTKLVSVILSRQLDPQGIACATRGEIKRRVSDGLLISGPDGEQDLKPDIDIVVYDKATEKVIAIVSCKTTLAERIMQTVRWKEAIANIPSQYRDVKVFLVTAWDTFDNPTQRNRARTLDGAYACNEDIVEDDRIKKFDKLAPDIIALRDRMIDRRTRLF